MLTLIARTYPVSGMIKANFHQSVLPLALHLCTILALSCCGGLAIWLHAVENMVAKQIRLV